MRSEGPSGETDSRNFIDGDRWEKGKEQDIEGRPDAPLNAEDPEESDGVEKELQLNDEDVVQEMAKDAEQSLLLQDEEGRKKGGRQVRRRRERCPKIE